MKCSNCYYEGKADCNHMPTLMDKTKESVESDTVTVKFLGYTNKRGGQIYLLPENEANSSDAIRVPQFDTTAQVPNPAKELLIFVNSHIKSLLTDIIHSNRTPRTVKPTTIKAVIIFNGDEYQLTTELVN